MMETAGDVQYLWQALQLWSFSHGGSRRVCAVAKMSDKL